MPSFGRPTAEDERKAREWAQWFAERNHFAIASLVLGIFSLIEFGALVVFGIAGIVFGIIALVQLWRRGRSNDHVIADARDGRNKGHALAWSGIALSAASLVVAGILYLRVFG